MTVSSLIRANARSQAASERVSSSAVFRRSSRSLASRAGSRPSAQSTSLSNSILFGSVIFASVGCSGFYAFVILYMPPG